MWALFCRYQGGAAGSSYVPSTLSSHCASAALRRFAYFSITSAAPIGLPVAELVRQVSSQLVLVRRTLGAQSTSPHT
jgi:hypothetical protein